MRWLYHVLERGHALAALDPTGAAPPPQGLGPWGPHPARLALLVDDAYAPPSLVAEGFIHCSYRPAVVASARLFFPAGADLRVLQIDPRRVEAPVDVAVTPRGPMPHLCGPLRRSAIVAVLELAELAAAPDELET